MPPITMMEDNMATKSFDEMLVIETKEQLQVLIDAFEEADYRDSSIYAVGNLREEMEADKIAILEMMKG